MASNDDMRGAAIGGSAVASGIGTKAGGKVCSLRLPCFYNKYFTEHFCGPGRAIRRVCVCLCGGAITFELSDLRSRRLACWFTLILFRQSSKVKVIGQSSRILEESKDSATAAMTGRD